MLNYIMTQGGIHLVLNGDPVTVAKTDKAFEAVLEAVKRKAGADEVLALLSKEKERVEHAVQATPRLSVKGGSIYFDDEVVNGLVGERMLQMLDEGFDLTPMEKFLANLMENPSKKAVDHLYKFLEYGKSPITEDGCFLVYKAVCEDFKDIHSGTFDNSVGAVVQMRRNRVDENPDVTCSQGLHVCSFGYLPHFAHANGHVMVCKVNPADVVAIPSDYANTKMRVCRYEVIAEHEGYYAAVREDTLANAAVSSGDDARVFAVEGLGGDDEWVVVESYARLSEAAKCMEQLLDDVDFWQVRIRNTARDVVVDRQVSSSEDSGSDDSEEDEDTSSFVHTYALYGIEAATGQEVRLLPSREFVTVVEAMRSALDFEAGYSLIEVRSLSTGKVVKTLT